MAIFLLSVWKSPFQPQEGVLAYRCLWPEPASSSTPSPAPAPVPRLCQSTYTLQAFFSPSLWLCLCSMHFPAPPASSKSTLPNSSSSSPASWSLPWSQRQELISLSSQMPQHSLPASLSQSIILFCCNVLPLQLDCHFSRMGIMLLVVSSQQVLSIYPAFSPIRIEAVAYSFWTLSPHLPIPPLWLLTDLVTSIILHLSFSFNFSPSLSPLAQLSSI